MLIRKNTKAFKTILAIITACLERPDRDRLIRLYITKAGQSVQDRISVEGIQDSAGLFYEMNYQTILNNLKSSNHQLHQSDNIPGIYFFRSTSNKAWDETPFEFDDDIKKEFASLSDLPAVKKKGKADKFVLPTPARKRETSPKTKTATAKTDIKKVAKVMDKGPKQPNYKLKQDLYFSNLEKIVYREAGLTKRNVIDYYNKVAEYILPHLKDRPLLIRLHSEGGRSVAYSSLEQLAQKGVQIPDWIYASKRKEKEQLLLCNDREHLLYYAELGCVQFDVFPFRVKGAESPDYLVIGIEAPDAGFQKGLDVALVARDILSGLKLPSFLKTDGSSGLHLYVPLDTKTSAATAVDIAEYICKLIRIKAPDAVALKGSDNYSYSKVSLDFLLNRPGERVIAPYSLAAGDSPSVATPLLWEDVEAGFQLRDLNYETIFKRVSQVGDPFESLSRKRVSGDALRERLVSNYSFLI